MSAFEELSKYFKKGIIEKAKEMGYSSENICILEGNEEKLKNNYPKIYQNLKSCVHNRDNRTSIQYAQDLVASWVFEDCIISSLKNAGLIIEHAGADKNREILSHINVSSTADSKILHKNKVIPLEIMCDYKGYWLKNKRIDLRDNKFLKLKNEGALFLGISTKDSKFIIVDFNKSIDAEYIKSHFPYGGKPAYSINIKSDMLFPFEIQLLVSTIENMI